MKRRDFLKTVGCGTAALLSGCTTETTSTITKPAPHYRKRRKMSPSRPVASRPPNILWLISEDTSPDIGCYGNTLVKTPNIDRLASEGALYTNAFVTAPGTPLSRSERRLTKQLWQEVG